MVYMWPLELAIETICCLGWTKCTTLQVYMRKVPEQEGNPHMDAQLEATKVGTILACQPSSKRKIKTIIVRGQPFNRDPDHWLKAQGEAMSIDYY